MIALAENGSSLPIEVVGPVVLVLSLLVTVAWTWYLFR